MQITQAAHVGALRIPFPGEVPITQAFTAAVRPWNPHTWVWISLEQNQDSVTTTRGRIFGTPPPPAFAIPVYDPGQSLGWSQPMQTSWQPVWPSAGPLLVQLVTNDSELAAKYLCSPVIDPEAGAYVKLLSERCIRDCLVNDSANLLWVRMKTTAVSNIACHFRFTFLELFVLKLWLIPWNYNCFWSDVHLKLTQHQNRI